MSTDFNQTPYLTRALNWASIDALANTPDHVLAEKLEGCPALDAMFRAYVESTRAERDRQVAAQALRDAANAYTDFDGDRGTSGVVRRWLRERANDLARADSAAPAPAAPQIAVDGSWGPQTTRALQRVLGTPVDGVIPGQYPNAVTRAIPACDFSTRGGSTVIRALQRRLGVPADGYIGPETVSALQRYLGTPVDGVVSRPRSLMVEALQRRLNTGRL